MYKVKLVVNDYERWLTALHYEYFCPVAVDERYYRKFLQKNFPYEINDADDLHPYNHRSVPSIKPNVLEKRLQKQSMDEAKFANHSSGYSAANDFSSFSDTDPVKEDYLRA
ncbi:hypothetical protein [Saccharicrinis fermentans]|uniref:Uncharacterized protein n=1 Tax=Saccharicrinis fermentans DSM 9555 = JCM 21142 TaxID=869213 RepID=W7YMF9_9BACT|nr:hypothetical protein [Saccharicrinis fermentans]GAF05856.1 hypothetical protein JCM21142_114612 [Saccharicrinis fermentans DSM 9555 = JCM 21142]